MALSNRTAWPLVAGLMVAIGLASSGVQGQSADNRYAPVQDTTLPELSRQLRTDPKHFADGGDQIDRFESLLARDTNRLVLRLPDLPREKGLLESYQLITYHTQIGEVVQGERLGDLHVALGHRLISLARATDRPKETYEKALANWRSPLKLAASSDLLGVVSRGWIKDRNTAGECLLLSAIGLRNAGRVIESQWAIELAEHSGLKGADTEIARILLLIDMGQHTEARAAVRQLLADADDLPKGLSESLSRYSAGTEFFLLDPSPSKPAYVTVREGMVQAQVHMVPLDLILDDLSPKLNLKFEGVPADPPRVVLSTAGEFVAPSRFISRLASAAHLWAETGEDAKNTIRFKPYVFSIYWWSDEKLRATFGKPKRVSRILNNLEKSVAAGYLIVDGHAVPPPYSIEAKDTTVYFNGVAVANLSRPARTNETGAENAVKPPPEGEAKSYEEIGAIVRSEWARLPADLSFSRKKALIIEQLRKEPFLKKVWDGGSGVMTTYMRPDGKEESYLWSLVDPGRSVVEPNFADVAQATVKEIQECLQRGGLVYWIDDKVLSQLSASDALRAMLQTNYVLLHMKERRDSIQALVAIGWGNDQAGLLLCNFEASQSLEDDVCCDAIRVILEGFAERRVETILQKEVQK